MSGYWSVRHTRGYDRLPKIRGYGTIPADDARHDDLNDLLAAKLRQFWRAQDSHSGWTNELEHLRRDVERMCDLSGYKGLWVDARDYLVHRVGQSFLYDVPIDKRGKLSEFAGKRIRVVCTHNGTNQRYVRIGVVGDAPTPTKTRRKKASDPASQRPRLPACCMRTNLPARRTCSRASPAYGTVRAGWLAPSIAVSGIRPPHGMRAASRNELAPGRKASTSSSSSTARRTILRSAHRLVIIRATARSSCTSTFTQPVQPSCPAMTRLASTGAPSP